jgi:hypothetical protein
MPFYFSIGLKHCTLIRSSQLLCLSPQGFGLEIKRGKWTAHATGKFRVGSLKSSESRPKPS